MAHDLVEEMSEAANAFLNTLNEEQKKKAVFELKDDERLNWHFVPKKRNGLAFKEMSPEQRTMGHALLSSSMSHRGYFKANTIISLEQILRDMEKRSGPTRDPEQYFFSIFGKPEPKGTWGWRFEGHHLSLNFAIADGKLIAATPSFMGTNPGEVREGPRKGLRVLAHEEELARKLVKSFNADQKKVAIYSSDAPADIITGADRKARPLDPKGISLSKLTGEQKELFWAITREYIGRARGEFAEKELAEIKKGGEDQLFFAWAGSLEPKAGHYYRIQGPTFLLEYDNTQNNANHVHAVWRDLTKDFGGDVLRDHYDKDHAKD
ncbi:MAG: DUF3500 domain-containing protein [Verrucomicrobiales bacterium]